MVFWFRVLRFICPLYLYEEIEGDLIQKFNLDVKKFGESKAKRRLIWNAIRFFRPGIILRNNFSVELNQLYMLRTYVVLASRSFVRNKTFSLINVLGLSVSMVVCILILQYVRFELSYDDFHRSAKNIYRVATKVTLQNEVINHETNTYDGISKALKEEFPEVKAATTIGGFSADNTFIRYEDKKHTFTPLQTYKAFSVDSTFFDVFSFPLLKGDPRVALRDPYSALISETMANQYFDGNPLGKILETNDGEERRRFKITGILKDIPANSHIKFDLLIHAPATDKNFWGGTIGFWGWGGQTYVLLHDYAERASLEHKLNQLAVSKNGLKNNKDDYGQVSTFELQPLLDIHLYSHILYELETNGSSALVFALIFLASIIIIIAWVNYVNLSTAISKEKTKSIGIRKVVGASRVGLISQILTESALFNTLSVLIAIILVHLLLPAFTSFVGIPLDYSTLYDKWVCLVLICFIFASTLMSGFYPAIVISSFYPVRALKGKISSGSNFTFRRALVVFQFAAAIMLMITTVVAYQQLSFMRSTELGININQVVIIKAMNFDKETWSNAAGGYVIDSAYLNKADLFKEELRSNAAIVNATSLSHLPGEIPNWGTEFKAETIDPEKAYRLLAIGIDYDFINTLQVKLLAGRNFSPEFPSDHGNEGKRAVLINEAASKLLGFKNPEEAVHSHISTYWGADYEIIGVLNSFHQLSLKENLEPLYFILQPRALSYYAINFKGENVQEAIEQIRSSWDHHFPDYPFNYFFLDQYFDKQYQYEQKFSSVMGLFSGLAVFIACLGLFGLTSYAIVQRTKEIGIRKVLGATVTNVIGLFTRDFVKLILAANVIAVPLVYFGVSRWLESYAFRIALGWWLFAVPFVLILLIALVTVSLQTIKVALRNPVESLKYE